MIDKKSKRKFLLELQKTGSIYSACNKAGFSRMTVHRWRKKNKEFRKEMDEAIAVGRENLCDISEHALMLKVKDKDLGAIKYALGHNSDRYKPHQQDTFKYLFDHRSNKVEKTERISFEDILDRMAKDNMEHHEEREKEKREKLMRDIDHALPRTSTGDPIPPWEVRMWGPQISEWREKVREAFKNGTPFPSDIMKPLDINLDSISIEDPPPPEQPPKVSKKWRDYHPRRDPVGDGD